MDVNNVKSQMRKVGSMGETEAEYALKLAASLRAKGRSVETDLVGRSVKAQMKYADKIGAKYVVIIGDEEIKTNTLKVKDMTTGEQQSVSADKL